MLVMDGRLRRQIGRKVTDCGGNALLGYQAHFDLEDNFIIARGIGTAVTLERRDTGQMNHSFSTGHAGTTNTLVSMNNSLPSSTVAPPSSAAAVVNGSDPVTASPLVVDVENHAAIGTLQLSLEDVPKFQESASPSVRFIPADNVLPSLKELEPLPQAQLRTLHRSKREHFRANLRLQDIELFSLQVIAEPPPCCSPLNVLQEFPSGTVCFIGGMVAARSVKVDTDSC